MAETEDRIARLERAWTSLSSYPKTKITVAALAREAGCSNTYAAPFRRLKADAIKRARKDAATPPVSEPKTLELQARDQLQSTLLKLASTAQDQVGQMIHILDAAVSRQTEASLQRPNADMPRGDRRTPHSPFENPPKDYREGAAPSEPQTDEADEALTETPKPFVQATEAPLAPASSLPPAPPPRRTGRKRNQDPCQLVLSFASSLPKSDSPDVCRSARQAEIPSLSSQIPVGVQKAADADSFESNSLPDESDDHTSIGEARLSIIFATRDILLQERGPLGPFAIAEQLQKLKAPSFPKKRLKELLFTACPKHFEYEAASETFWSNLRGVSDTGIGQPMSIRAAAVIEAVRLMDARRLPAEMEDLYSGLTESVRSQIARASFDLALKTADTRLGDLRQNEYGRWFLAKYGDLDPFKRRPTKIYGALRRALLKILTASQYSLPPLKILAALPDPIARHFTATNIEEHLGKVSRGLERDVAGYLSIKRTKLLKTGKRGVSLGKLARTAGVVDDAIDRLEAERRVLSLDDLYEAGCGIERDAFRKAMNQRQKSSGELERIGEGLYRYNPVLG